MPVLVNDANFFVVIIALLIISFLLGLIVGKIFFRPDERKINCSQNEASDFNESLQATNPTQTDSKQSMNPPQCQERCPDDMSKYIYYW